MLTSFNSKNYFKIKCFIICIVFHCFLLCESSITDVQYKLYAGNTLGQNEKRSLTKCVQGIALNMLVVGVQFYSGTHVCNHIDQSWLDNRLIDGSTIYTKKEVVERFEPPMYVKEGVADYRSNVPGRFYVGSELNFYVSTLDPNAMYYFVMIENPTNRFLSLLVFHNTSTLRLRCIIDSVDVCAKDIPIGFTLLTDVTYKYTLYVIEVGVEVYINDILITVFNDPNNLLLPSNTFNVTCWTMKGTGTSHYLHRVTMKFSDP